MTLKQQLVFFILCLTGILVGTNQGLFSQIPLGNLSATFDSTSVSHQETDSATRQDDVSPTTLGISTSKPEEGPFVELPDGTFMVPYSIFIPGTDVEFTMIPIPGGRFTMGSPESESDRSENEGPQFEVRVQPFWMGKCEVTWAEYKRYMQMDDLFRRLHEIGKRTVSDVSAFDVITAPSSLYDPSFTYGDGGEPNQPAATITQFAAKQYTKWLSLMTGDFYRLPYEAEWEYACRAGTTTAYYFGDDSSDLEDHAWYVENCDERQPVGQKLPNPWGLHDMYGNVAEWVLDEFSTEGYTHISGDNLTVEDTFRQPKEVDPRVVRGGHYLAFEDECRSAARLGSEKKWRDDDPNTPKSPWWYTNEPATGVGFRLLRPLQVPARDQQDLFWKADVERIIYETKGRIEDNGRGRFGTVDPQLPRDIQQLSEKK
jgi:sulfatase modifying factor 1